MMVLILLFPSTGRGAEAGRVLLQAHLSIVSALGCLCLVPDSLLRGTDVQRRGKDWTVERFIVPFSIKHMLNMGTERLGERQQLLPVYIRRYI